MGERGGWTVLKAIGVAIGLLFMVGFGLCSVFGFAVGSGSADVYLLALLGAGLSALFGWMVAAIFRSVRRDRDSDT